MAIKLTQETHTMQVKDLYASVQGKAVLKGVNLTIKSGEVHALMGPNGSGKSTLSAVILGHPSYTIESGDILFNGDSILQWTPEQRAKAGLFLAFQYPVEVPGVSVANFLRTAYNESRPKERQLSVMKFNALLEQEMKTLHMPPAMAERYLNDGFSGGEKKRGEILQMAILSPKIALMDETDSGLDVDALRIVADGCAQLVKKSRLGVLLVTHYPRILHYLKPDHVHLFVDGKIVQSGGMDLAEQVEKTGYGSLEKTGAKAMSTKAKPNTTPTPPHREACL
ncbi:Fe-S cluster assembly ATPase SufC [Candidatus Micrarchaeota archaeon]|nr:Fe-S cluster assembly ATPase SufC [Candidatus Micrarchaeota archaeon]